MACGCKNNQNSNNQQTSAQKIQEVSKQTLDVSANIKETIQKTVQKYYNNNQKTKG